MIKRPGDDTLCCCEYENTAGEHAHLIQCCCDCEALDSICDRMVSCKNVPDSELQRLVSTVADRCRIPWCSGKGAFRLQLDVAVPSVVVPLGIMVAAQGPWCTVFAMTVMPFFMFMFYRLWVRSKSRRRTRIFHMWTLVSCLLMYYSFEVLVCSYREILFWENVVLSLLFAATMWCMHSVRQSPSPEPPTHTPHTQHTLVDAADVKWVDSRPFIDGRLETYCAVCEQERTPRSGHCGVCNVCVQGRDHHCVWIDQCVGVDNHRVFLAGGILFLLTALYGIHLTMTTVCTPDMYYDWFLVPVDCRLIYNSVYSAIPFVCVIYSSIAVLGVSVAVCQQMALISQNVTTQELAAAHRRGWTFWGLYVYNNANNRGFRKNWKEFLSGRRKYNLRYTTNTNVTV